MEVLPERPARRRHLTDRQRDAQRKRARPLGRGNAVAVEHEASAVVEVRSDARLVHRHRHVASEHAVTRGRRLDVQICDGRIVARDHGIAAIGEQLHFIAGREHRRHERIVDAQLVEHRPQRRVEVRGGPGGGGQRRECSRRAHPRRERRAQHDRIARVPPQHRARPRRDRHDRSMIHADLRPDREVIIGERLRHHRIGRAALGRCVVDIDQDCELVSKHGVRVVLRCLLGEAKPRRRHHREPTPLLRHLHELRDERDVVRVRERRQVRPSLRRQPQVTRKRRIPEPLTSEVECHRRALDHGAAIVAAARSHHRECRHGP